MKKQTFAEIAEIANGFRDIINKKLVKGHTPLFLQQHKNQSPLTQKYLMKLFTVAVEKDESWTVNFKEKEI